MKYHTHRAVLAASATLLFSVASLVHAHEAGDFILRSGIVGASLSSETITASDSLTDNFGNPIGSIGSRLKKNDVQAGLNLTYMVTDHVGIEFMLTSQFSHKVTAYATVGSLTDSIGIGKIKQLPLSLNAVFYPMDKQSAFQPYVGAGINYTFADLKLNPGFNDFLVGIGGEPVTAGDLKRAVGIKNRFGWNVAVGADYSLTKNWLINANVRYVRTNNKAGDEEGIHMAKGTTYYMLGLGYKF